VKLRTSTFPVESGLVSIATPLLHMALPND